MSDEQRLPDCEICSDTNNKGCPKCDVVDPDTEQAKDEANAPWANRWKDTVKRNDARQYERSHGLAQLSVSVAILLMFLGYLMSSISIFFFLLYEGLGIVFLIAALHLERNGIHKYWWGDENGDSILRSDLEASK